jgi:hypothetical protein
VGRSNSIINQSFGKKIFTETNMERKYLQKQIQEYITPEHTELCSMIIGQDTYENIRI